MQPVLLLHGGVGLKTKTKEQRDQILRTMKKAIVAGYKQLILNGSAVDGVEDAIKIMEESGILNAGRGAVTQKDGQQRMDASIMRSNPLKAGAVASLRGCLHPISVARQIMEKTPHVMIAQDFAKILADTWAIPSIPLKSESKRNKKKGGDTVGAVALDRSGILAAGSSTGGLPNVDPGRIGDSPIIGSGTYANEFCASSATGIGEDILRINITRLVSFLSEFQKLPPQTCIDRALDYYRRYFDTTLGLITIDALGHWGIGFIGQEMPWAIMLPAGQEKLEVRVGMSAQDFTKEEISNSQL